MKIKFFKSHELEKPFRLSVHKSGKLGFTTEAAEALGLTRDKSISIGANEDDPSDKRLYMVLNDTHVEGAFKVQKAGDYFSLPIKLLLDALEIPYAEGTLAFNMDKKEVDGGTYYRLTRIEAKKKVRRNDAGIEIVDDTEPVEAEVDDDDL